MLFAKWFVTSFSESNYRRVNKAFCRHNCRHWGLIFSVLLLLIANNILWWQSIDNILTIIKYWKPHNVISFVSNTPMTGYWDFNFVLSFSDSKDYNKKTTINRTIDPTIPSESFYKW